MGRNNVHQAVKNVIHNELELTKEELLVLVRNEISKAVQQAVEKAINTATVEDLIIHRIHYRVDMVLDNSISYTGYQTVDNAIKHHLADYVAKEIMDKLELSVQIKEV